MAEGMKYIQAGEVMIPDLTTVQEQIDIGKYGSMRRRFLQEHRRGTYSAMILQGTLNRYLREVNEQTKSRIEELVTAMVKKDPGPDKAADQMGWVRHQNNLRQQAEEMVLPEMIYS